MDYKKIYNSIVKKGKVRKLEKTKRGYEVHHIVPRSLGGSNRKENLVKLTLKEHYLAHKLLTKFLTGSDKHKMCCAVKLMESCGKYKTSRSFVISKNINLAFYRYYNRGDVNYKTLYLDIVSEIRRINKIVRTSNLTERRLAPVYASLFKGKTLFKVEEYHTKNLCILIENMTRLGYEGFTTPMHSKGYNNSLGRFVSAGYLKRIPKKYKNAPTTFILGDKTLPRIGLIYNPLFKPPYSTSGKRSKILFDRQDSLIIRQVKKPLYRIEPRVYMDKMFLNSKIAEDNLFVDCEVEELTERLSLMSEEINRGGAMDIE